ncbi:MAG: STAS domain-containing protein [Ignavibacterium sp.]
MDFTKEIFGDITVEVVNLTRATMKEAEEFKKILSNDIDLGARKIVVDLSECEFIDSTFLGALVVSLKKITALGGDLKLVGFQPSVHSMFELTRMYRVFEAFPSKKEAIESYGIQI